MNDMCGIEQSWVFGAATLVPIQGTTAWGGTYSRGIAAFSPGLSSGGPLGRTAAGTIE